MTHVVVTMPFSPELLDKLQAVSPTLRVEQITLQDGRWLFVCAA